MRAVLSVMYAFGNTILFGNTIRAYTHSSLSSFLTCPNLGKEKIVPQKTPQCPRLWGLSLFMQTISVYKLQTSASTDILEAENKTMNMIKTCKTQFFPVTRWNDPSQNKFNHTSAKSPIFGLRSLWEFVCKVHLFVWLEVIFADFGHCGFQSQISYRK